MFRSNYKKAYEKLLIEVLNFNMSLEYYKLLLYNLAKNSNIVLSPKIIKSFFENEKDYLKFKNEYIKSLTIYFVNKKRKNIK
jgi:hypothetical protein|tara:strand:- start:9 stop:254 length:246 start_codon:yes stop_codon:yes gene_type:complete